MQILHIFIKNARLGYVKTRLAATVGEEEALRIYRILLSQTRMVAQVTDGHRWLWYSDKAEAQDEWPNAEFDKHVQVSGDLGQRMCAAFRAGFEQGATKALIIGSDCPTLTSNILQQAFDALDHTDIVIGATPDGGYYLLGMNQLYPAVFSNIAWSTDAVYSSSCAIIEALGLTKTDLPVLGDVDNEGDWNLVKDQLVY